MDNTLLVTTSTSLEGYKIVKQLGLVRGITVRSRSIIGNIAGGFMTIFGGKSSIYTELFFACVLLYVGVVEPLSSLLKKDVVVVNRS